MIRVLPPEVAGKIAAGEVIDRPFSIVRELLDNSLDAGSRTVEVHLEAGGLERIRVVDDGEGMSADDLGLCIRSHATSKINSAEDLWRLETLGFRGEALASIGACARLEIVSRRRESPQAHRIVVEGGKVLAAEPHAGGPGTVVDVSRLFHRMPARKRFLKSAAAESGMCRTILLERVVAFEGVAFRLFVNGAIRHYFPPTGVSERLAEAYDEFKRSPPGIVEWAEQGFSVRAVLCPPETMRRDRRLVQIFVNRRRVQEWPLVQAVEYAYTGYLPNGAHPVAFLFVEVEPDRVDFNIHPAKREVRLVDGARIHRAVARRVREWLGRTARVTVAGAGKGALERSVPGVVRDLGLPDGYAAKPGPEALSRGAEGQAGTGAWTGLEVGGGPTGGAVRAEDRRPEGSRIRYLGQVFGLFLAAELDGSFFLVDQHAAHERVLYERLRARKAAMQELLIAFSFELEEEADRFVQEHISALAGLGIRLQRHGERRWEITHLREELQRLGEGELVRLIVDSGGEMERFERELFASLACRLAVKDGEYLDALTAGELLQEAFALADARCPHGRPIWWAISREQLLRHVKRLG